MWPGPYHTLIEQGRPSIRIQLADVKDVVVEGPRRVRFDFKTTQNRELPLIVGGLPVLPKHFFDGRDFTKPLTDAPIGSGPYRITNFELGRSVTYTRDPNWWAANLPTGRGTNNFDTVRTNISATRPSRWRPSKPAKSTFEVRTSPKTGLPPTTFRLFRAAP